MPTLAVHSAIVLSGVVFVLAVIVLVLLIVAPWRSVRDEPALDDEVETRLLLGEDPDRIAAEEEAEIERERAGLCAQELGGEASDDDAR